LRLRDIVKRELRRRLRLVIHRHPAPGDPAHRRSVLLNDCLVDLVVDVGANAGQYACELRDYGYAGKILSLEPTAGAFSTLAEKATQDPDWTAIRTAAGTKTGAVTMNVACNSVSSSIRPMLDRHLAAAPTSQLASTEEVPIARLDSLALEHVNAAAAPFLKIDTQGYEREVLEGASALLPRFVGLEVELSLGELYEGQHLWLDQIRYLESAGFRLAGVSSGFWDQATGETLQMDGLFVAQC
jgi:FkbM family methyltransferase